MTWPRPHHQKLEEQRLKAIPPAAEGHSPDHCPALSPESTGASGCVRVCRRFLTQRSKVLLERVEGLPGRAEAGGGEAEQL